MFALIYKIPKLLELISAPFFTNVDMVKLCDYRNGTYLKELLNLVGILSRTMFQIDDNMTRNVFASAPRILEKLLLDPDVFFTTKEQKSMIKALTLIDPTKGNAFTINLTSPNLFDARGRANLMLGWHKKHLQILKQLSTIMKMINGNKRLVC